MSVSLPIAETPPRLVDALLAEQQSMTAVQRFSAAQEGGDEHGTGHVEPAQARYYRDLLPASAPGPGQQYGFEVDLDACSGCKACVVACHTMNGLQEDETWRKVGLLSGGGKDRVQHVTTACHHCVDPGCLSGCPVKAYDKDPETGIVRHLDDQCIGCKYCTMMCPYEVPQYSESLGIVRKCDMCHQRLSVGEAPACVQSCPNGAIRIALVETHRAQAWAAEPDARLVPQAPNSKATVPTTRYLGAAQGDGQLAAQDRSTDQPAESHWPLAVMLVLTQASVGMLLTERLVTFAGGTQAAAAATALAWTLGVSLLVGVAGLNLAALHLGQPLKAWRVFLGLRTSWLSREAIVLGQYAGLLALATALAWWPRVAGELPEWAESLSGRPLTLTLSPAEPGERGLSEPLGGRFASFRRGSDIATAWWVLPVVYGAAIVAGAAGVYCSGMIYVATGRRLWRPSRTLIRFYGTALSAGSAAVLPILVGCGVDVPTCYLAGNLALLATVGKGWWEWRIHLGSGVIEDRDDARSRRLAVEPLHRWRLLRLTCAALGAFALVGAMAAIAVPHRGAAIAFGALAAASVIAGEIAERLLYFSTVVHDRMPRTVS